MASLRHFGGKTVAKVSRSVVSCSLRYNSAMQHPFDEVRKLAMRLPEDQRLALALDLYADVIIHPGLGEPELG